MSINDDGHSGAPADPAKTPSAQPLSTSTSTPPAATSPAADSVDPTAASPDAVRAARTALLRDVPLFIAIRIAVVAVITMLILWIGHIALPDVGIPLVIALLFGVLIALPVSFVIFRGLRARINTNLGIVSARRTAERADLRSQLRGEE